MPPLEKKSNALSRIYEIYEKFVASIETACEKYCADCCTCNVTLTSLEAYRIVTHLQDRGEQGLIHELASLEGRKRFQPGITTNRLAELCMGEEEIPREECDPSWGRCPFLLEEACRIYPVRPFGCRCLLSSQKCRATGYAEVTPFVLTVNTVFMQVIEHLDQNGLSGNLTDVVRWLAVDTNCHAYQTGNLASGAPGPIMNRPLPCLMIPEEHRGEIRELLVKLQEVDRGDR
jgi:Fe-S-cluster containining protein